MRVCLVVPSPGPQADHVAAAIRGFDPGAELLAVWAGDPQLRPVAPVGGRWIDAGLPEPSGIGWQRLLIGLPVAAYALARGCCAVARQIRRDADPIVLLRVGAVAVTGSLEPFVTERGATVGLRRAGRVPVDGLAPDIADLAGAGRFVTSVIGFGADAAELADALGAAAIGCAPDHDPGPALEQTVLASGAHGETSVVHAVGWSVPGSAEPAVLDVSALDPDDPTRIDFDRPPRHPLSATPSLVAALAASRPQWAAIDTALRLPGGYMVDDTVRGLVAGAIDGWRRGVDELPPQPWGECPAEFVRWLETPAPVWGPDVGRYWSALRDRRGDLRDAFPQPEGRDRAALTEWAHRRWRFERVSPLLRPLTRPMRPPWSDVSRAPDGVNLVGYLGFDSSLGDVARRAKACLDAAEVAVAPLHYHRSGSPLVAGAGATLDAEPQLRYATNLVVVNADQFPLLDVDYGSVLFPGRRTVGYWFWDVEYVPPSVVAASRFVDEIWVATEFTAAALADAVDKPVRVVEIPVPEPVPSVAPDAIRAQLGIEPGRFMAVVTFDHLSVAERKNPAGAIAAFRLAFPEPTPGGPVLVVKSINASHRPHEHERLLLAAGRRDDIVIVDRHLTRGEQLALIAAADCLVSLHRSEGLGLHLIEAMWLGTPTIATRYSGNLAFMDDDNSALIDARMVPVTRGEGYFPNEATWADPDLDQAATWLHRLATDADLCGRLAEAARARMLRQPTPAEAGATIARLAIGGGG